MRDFLIKLGFINTSITCTLFFFFLNFSRIVVGSKFIELYGFIFSILISAILFFREEKVKLSQILLFLLILIFTLYSFVCGLIPNVEILKFAI